MNASTLFVKLWMVSRRDLLTAVRYRMGFWLQAIGVAGELAAFFYLALAIGPGFRPEGMEYFPFLLVGTALHGFLVAGVSHCVSTVRDAQLTGTMEVLMTTSTPAPVIVFLSTFSTFAGRTVHLLLYLAAGFLLFQVSPEQINLPACLLIYALTLILAVAIGVVAAAARSSLKKAAASWFFFLPWAGSSVGRYFPSASFRNRCTTLPTFFP